MKKIYTLFLSAIISGNMLAQAPSIEWQKSLGGSDYDAVSSIIQTSDGGYVVAGYSASNNGDVSGNHGNDDCWIVKLDALGNITWQKSLGGSDYDVANSIIQTSDGGYVVAGYSDSNNGDVSGNHGNNDCWIVKLDALGNITWQKSLGGSDYDVAQFIIQTSDGGYVVAGHSESNNGDVSGNHGNFDYWVVKLDALGNITWQKSLGGIEIELAYSIIQTSDGGYVVAGSSDFNDGDVSGNHGSCDYWVVKLDALGTITWQKSLGGSDWDYAHSLIQTSDGGYVVAGYSNSNDDDVSGNHGNNDYWIVKLDALGNITWQKSLGGSDIDVANSIIQTSDGSYVVAGLSYSNNGDASGNHGESDSWIVKLDTLGNITWQKSLGGSDYDQAQFIIPTSDGGYVAAGFSQSNNGDVSGNHGAFDYWVVKLAPDSTIITQTPENPIFSIFTLYPNPAGEVLNIDYTPNQKIAEHTYTVFDLQGKQIQKGILQLGKNALNISQLPAGHYMIKTPVGTQPFEVVR